MLEIVKVVRVYESWLGVGTFVAECIVRDGQLLATSYFNLANPRQYEEKLTPKSKELLAALRMLYA